MRYRTIHTLVCFLLLMAANIQADNLTQPVPLVPCPVSIVPGTGNFHFSEKTTFAVENEEQAVEVRRFTALLTRAAGFTPRIKVGNKKGDVCLTTDAGLKKEAYKLEITAKRINIHAADVQGFFYALQSIRQLLPAAIEGGQVVTGIDWTVPAVTITDQPRFGYRGLLVDVARFFSPKENLLRIIDCMAMLKLNTLHFHLTDDNGWRIEIKQYPHLTRTGGSVGKGEEQQGFYTQEEIRDIIEYARQRNITIVPEIDMPGHAEAALSAYPELGCFGLPVEIPQSGFTQNIFCAGKDGTLRFLKNVLDEVCALFPSPYIHLGGDEAPKGNWDQCPDCRKRITTEGLKDSHDLQLWFSAQMANYLKSKGRKAIFWGDVVYHDGYPLPDNTVIQWWNYRGHKDLALRNAVKHHYPVICSSNYYTFRQSHQREKSADTWHELRIMDRRRSHGTNDRPTTFPPHPRSVRTDVARGGSA